jgi:hypothetical protein
LRWIPFELDEQDLRNRIKNKMIRPTTIPQTLQDLQIEHAIAREALRLALQQHKLLAVGLKGIHQQRTIADAFEQKMSGESLIDMSLLDLVVGSGGILSHAPKRVQAMIMMIDAYQLLGVTRCAVDSIFMMPHLGVLSTVNEKAAIDVFLKDCMVYLGTCIAPVGQAEPGQKCLSYRLDLESGEVSGELPSGELWLYPLEVSKQGMIEVTPYKPFDMGAGPGKPVKAKVEGGVVGLVIDTRGRPMQLPSDRRECINLVRRWADSVGLY